MSTNTVTVSATPETISATPDTVYVTADAKPHRGGPLLRSKDDETHDLQDVLVRFDEAAYRDWPNDAGFDGLTEERGPISLAVSGMIPSYVAGSLFRTGPGFSKVEGTPKGTFQPSHWFDGLAQTHRFDIRTDHQGKVQVSYSSRLQSEELMEHIKKTGSFRNFTFAQKQDPCLGLFSKLMGTWVATTQPNKDKWMDNVSVAVLPNVPGLESASGNLIGKIPSSNGPPLSSGHRPPLPGINNIWLTTDNSSLKQIDPMTLEPIGFAEQQILHPSLKGPLSCAHAQRDPVTGDLYNLNLDIGMATIYRLFCVRAATGKTEILAEIKGSDIKPAYLHSFFMSENYVVVCIPSSHLGWNGIKVPWVKNMVDAIEPFSEDKKTQWIVVDRVHGRGIVGRFESEASFFFHAVNAFEEDDGSKIVCDVVEYKGLDVIHKMYYDVILQQDGADRKFWNDKERAKRAMASLNRYRLDLSALPKNGKGTPEKYISIPAPHAGELPTMNPLYSTKRHRYVYSIPYRGMSTAPDCLVKTDVLTRDALFWDPPHGHCPGEGIFVPDPNGTEEDDGVLLSVVLDGHNRTSYLLCLDAKTMAELGRAEVGFAVAMGFHGAHIRLDGPEVKRVEGDAKLSS
ncbi:carotenoid oxygenase [Podospora australis]|uniref:Carotenoid oxygenase n=1 Tax=Podospora australis TaxID=1536484 RepID=A0AAN6WRA9_9PEZI|nr:carotenoid oxygenase [Podospora australis]